ncbi:hypothetical protein D3C71_1622680 [compost metagenome]
MTTASSTARWRPASPPTCPRCWPTCGACSCEAWPGIGPDAGGAAGVAGGRGGMRVRPGTRLATGGGQLRPGGGNPVRGQGAAGAVAGDPAQERGRDRRGTAARHPGTGMDAALQPRRQAGLQLEQQLPGRWPGAARGPDPGPVPGQHPGRAGAAPAAQLAGRAGCGGAGRTQGDRARG